MTQKVSSISSSNNSTTNNVVSSNSRKKNVMYVKRIISVLCTLAIFAGGLWYANGLFMNKRSKNKFGDFITNTQYFDVLFFGSSKTVNSISPIDLFHNFGITSFNMGMAGNYFESNYYILLETLELLKRKGNKLPNIVIVDVFRLHSSVLSIHNAWDFLPFLNLKKDMIQNIIPKENRIEFYFPLFLYHKRWNEITSADFLTEVNLLKGAELRYNVPPISKRIIVEKNMIEPLPEKKIEYLDMIREVCRLNNIQLVLVNLPYNDTAQNDRITEPRMANAVYEYANLHNIQYINYANEDVGLDYDVDGFDTFHLNPVGMRKVTNEIGKLLVANGVPDHRAEPEIAEKWNADYEYYVRYKCGRFGGLNQAKVYLMALNDRDFYGDVYVNSEMLDDVQIAKLVDNLKAIGHNVEIGNGRKQVKVGNNTKNYDIYCQTFMTNEREKPFHRAGFVYSESWAKQ